MVLFLFTAIGHSQNRLKVLNDSAMAIYKENPQKAIQLLEDALDISLKEKNKFESALSKNNLGIVYRDLGELEKAKQFSEESLEFGVLDEYIMASAYNNIGACNRKLGLYEEAIDSYLKALAIYESKGDLDKQATVNNNIGMVYSYL
ncbi:MAG: tetratricopeptide repeat protein, partial [Mangrovimonas sp.]|nr:tetratricopeptide repeat protein [Mangrovimonas sp.]